jgi:hypothetical protein
LVFSGKSGYIFCSITGGNAGFSRVFAGRTSAGGRCESSVSEIYAAIIPFSGARGDSMKNIVIKRKRSFMEKPRTPIEKRRTLEDRTDEYLRLSKEVYINCKAAVTLKRFRSLLVDLNRFLLNEGVIGYQELKLGLKGRNEGEKLQALLGASEQADVEENALDEDEEEEEQEEEEP